MQRTELYADPHNLFLHDLVLDSCRRNASKTAWSTLAPAAVDLCRIRRRRRVRCPRPDCRRHQARRCGGCIFFPTRGNSASHFMPIQLAGAIPTLLNPTYREREVRYQLENSGAVLLITDGANIEGINLAGLPNLRRIYTTRQPATGAEPFANLLNPVTASCPTPDQSSAADSGSSSLLQRHHWLAQGSHAFSLQSGRQRLPDAGPKRDNAQCR